MNKWNLQTNRKRLHVFIKRPRTTLCIFQTDAYTDKGTKKHFWHLYQKHYPTVASVIIWQRDLKVRINGSLPKSGERGGNWTTRGKPSENEPESWYLTELLLASYFHLKCLFTMMSCLSSSSSSCFFFLFFFVLRWTYAFDRTLQSTN